MNTQAGWEIFGSEYDDTLYVMPKDMQDGRGGKDTIAVIPEHLHDKKEKARLIAAAPDLLEAVVVTRMSRGWHEMTAEAKELIESAIARATGRG
jgi:hypothetical protein